MENKRQKLEGMLRAIQEMKSEYYIGSLQAYEMLRNSQKIEKSPGIVAETINKTIRERFDNPTYLASAARVSGIDNLLLNAGEFGEKPFLQDHNPKTSPIVYLTETFKGFKIFDLEFSVYNKPKFSARYLMPYFISANKDNVSEEIDFGTNFTFELLNYYQEIRKNIGKKLDRCDKFVTGALNYLQNSDWNFALSTRALSQRITILTRNSITPSTRGVLDRIINDRVDHRLEYRRQILCKWLRDCKPKDYETAVSDVDKLLNERVNRLRKNKKANAPEAITEWDEKLVNHAVFIRRLIGSEKNFVNKFLKS